MGDELERLSQRKRELLEKLAELRMRRLTIAECSEALGVSQRTLHYWIKEPAFQRLWSELTERWLMAGEAQVAELVDLAVRTLRELMVGAKSEHVRYEAAKAIGDWARLGSRPGETRRDDRSELGRLYELLEQRRVRVEVTRPALGSGEDEVVDAEVMALEAGPVGESQPGQRGVSSAG